MKIPANGFTHAGKFHADDVFATDCIDPQPRNGICRPGLLLFWEKVDLSADDRLTNCGGVI